MRPCQNARIIRIGRIFPRCEPFLSGRALTGLACGRDRTAAHLRGIGTEILGFAFNRVPVEPRDLLRVGATRVVPGEIEALEPVAQHRRA